MVSIAGHGPPARALSLPGLCPGCSHRGPDPVLGGDRSPSPSTSGGTRANATTAPSEASPAHDSKTHTGRVGMGGYGAEGKAYNSSPDGMNGGEDERSCEKRQHLYSFT